MNLSEIFQDRVSTHPVDWQSAEADLLSSDQSAINRDNLEKAYRNLFELVSARGARPRIREGKMLLQRFQQTLGEPSIGLMDDYVEKTLSVPHTLSKKANKGLYILLSLGVSERDLNNFLQTRNLEKFSKTEVLELVADLYRKYVIGLEKYFTYKPDTTGRVNNHFLSKNPKDLYSSKKEIEGALWMADMTDATSIKLSVQLPIEWRQLTSEERSYVETNIKPESFYGPDRKYFYQSTVEIDMLVDAQSKKRIVEVKVGQGQRGLLRDDLRSYMLLQTVRLCLLARIHGFEGVEYFIHASHYDKEFIIKALEIAEMMGVKCIIRVQNGEGKGVYVINPDLFLDYQVRSTRVESTIERNKPIAFPPVPILGQLSFEMTMAEGARTLLGGEAGFESALLVDPVVTGEEVREMEEPKFQVSRVRRHVEARDLQIRDRARVRVHQARGGV